MNLHILSASLVSFLSVGKILVCNVHDPYVGRSGSKEAHFNVIGRIQNEFSKFCKYQEKNHKQNHIPGQQNESSCHLIIAGDFNCAFERDTVCTGMRIQRDGWTTRKEKRTNNGGHRRISGWWWQGGGGRGGW